MIRIQGTLSDIEATILNCVIDPSAINIEFKNIEFNGESITDSKGRVFEKVKRGRWLKTGQSFIFPEKFRNYFCSECLFELDKKSIRAEFRYCPNCGARMDLDEVENG